MMADFIVSSETHGTEGDDNFIIDRNNHGYDTIYSDSGSDRYYLALDVDALGKTPHDLPEGGGQPTILYFDLDDYIVLPSGVKGGDLTFWNYSVGHENPPYGYTTTRFEIIYDPHDLYKHIFNHGEYAKRFGLTGFDKENFVGYGVSTYGGVFGHPDAVSAYNLRTAEPDSYEISRKAWEKEFSSRIGQRPTWKYETDRLASITIKTEDILGDPTFPDIGWIKNRILLSNGSPAFDREGSPKEFAGNTYRSVRSKTSRVLRGKEERLILTGTKAINGTGNGLNNRLTGNAANNILNGKGGADIIIGGKGKDTLTGSAGTDRFVCQSIKDSGVGKSRRDIITDFSRKAKEKIDLSAIDAYTKTRGNQAFTYIGSKRFSGKRGEVRFAGGVLQVNTGTDKVADMEIALTGVTAFQSNFLIL